MSNISNTTTDDLMDMYELNFLTAFNVAKPVYGWMKTTGGGKIVMITAKSVLEGGAKEVLPYALAKGSLLQFAEILNESGKDDNIDVSVVAPSIIDTQTNRDSMPNANFDDWVKPEDIAGNILHLISREGHALKGAVLKLYGNV
jgi:NAD(P)-dependent dehydrogenase (short-subunit alcohol dehydrogenase family)